MLKTGKTLTREQMASMYRSAPPSCYPRGARVGALPCAEAMASGTLLIASDFSGTTAFADSTNSLPVQCVVINARQGASPGRGGAGVAASVDARPPRGGGGARDEGRRRRASSLACPRWRRCGREEEEGGSGGSAARRLVDVD